MIVSKLRVENELGLHARVACRIVRKTAEFQSSIYIKKDNLTFNFKNITGVVASNAKQGDTLEVVFDGPDEIEASKALEQLFVSKFGER